MQKPKTSLQRKCEALQKRSKVLQEACQVKSDIVQGILTQAIIAVDHSKALIEKLSQRKLTSQD
jgi:hypothetical protein